LLVLPTLFSNLGYEVTVTNPPWSDYKEGFSSRPFSDLKNVNVVNQHKQFNLEYKKDHSHNLKIGEVIDKICRENQIQYQLGYGTLLGAVRHKGFIPWDDDIDIVMARPDYEKLINLLIRGCLPDEFSYGFISQKSYFYPFLKIYYKNSIVDEKNLKPEYTNQPIWIDIFPVDGLPESKLLIKFIYFVQNTLRKLLYVGIASHDKLSGIKKLSALLLKPITNLYNPNRISKTINTISKIIKYDNSKIVGNNVFGFDSRESIKKELFCEIELIDFENRKFFASKYYDIILTQYYGNYMELPPTAERKSHLSDECYIIE
jgi:lipopolysaccharide cholinephosphotransferase